jgi:hypothetical protein
MTANTNPTSLAGALAQSPLGAAAQAAAAAGCGIGPALSQVTAAINQATTAINSAIQTATDLISFVQSLPNLVAAEISAVVNSVTSNLLGEIQNLIDPLQREIATLMSLINDPVGFLSQYLNIQLLFPNLDLNGLLNQILGGTSICQATANASGNPASHPPSNQQAQPAPAPEPTPETPTVAESPNTSIRAQVSIENLTPGNESQRTLAEVRRQQIAGLNVELYRLQLQLNYASEEAVRSQISEQIAGVRERISSISSAGS